VLDRFREEAVEEEDGEAAILAGLPILSMMGGHRLAGWTSNENESEWRHVLLDCRMGEPRAWEAMSHAVSHLAPRLVLLLARQMV